MKAIIRNALFVVIIVLTIFFFVREFQTNWVKIKFDKITINFPFLLLSFLAVVSSYLLVTFSWRYLIQSQSGQNFRFVDALAIVNTSQLTKYIPGKIWSYFLQMHWLSQKGIPRILALSTNILLTLSLLLSASILSVPFTDISSREIKLIITLLLISVQVILIIFGTKFLNFLLSILSKILKRDIHIVNIPTKEVIKMQLWCYASNVCLGISGYLMCGAIGPIPNATDLLTITSAFLISDAIGFIAFFAPGGIGVKEVAMYEMLRLSTDMQTALLLPIATRILSMIVDALMGGTGLFFLRRFMRKSTENQNEA